MVDEMQVRIEMWRCGGRVGPGLGVHEGGTRRQGCCVPRGVREAFQDVLETQEKAQGESGEC